jgi:hypothetical protein
MVTGIGGAVYEVFSRRPHPLVATQDCNNGHKALVRERVPRLGAFQEVTQKVVVDPGVLKQCLQLFPRGLGEPRGRLLTGFLLSFAEQSGGKGAKYPLSQRRV